MASLHELKVYKEHDSINDRILSDKLSAFLAPIGSGTLVGIPLTIPPFSNSENSSNNEVTTPTIMVVVSDEAAPSYLAQYASWLVQNNESNKQQDEVDDEITISSEDIGFANLSINNRKASLNYVSAGFFRRFLLREYFSKGEEGEIKPLDFADYLILVDPDSQLSDMTIIDNLLSYVINSTDLFYPVPIRIGFMYRDTTGDLFADGLDVNNPLVEDVYSINGATYPNQIFYANESYVPRKQPVIEATSKKINLLTLGDNSSGSSKHILAFVSNASRGDYLSYILSKTNKKAIVVQLYNIMGDVEEDIIPFDNVYNTNDKKDTFIFIATDILQTIPILPKIGHVVDMMEMEVYKSSAMGTPYNEVRAVSKDVSDSRCSVTMLFENTACTRMIEEKVYFKLPSRYQTPTEQIVSHTHQISPIISTMILSTISAGLNPMKDLTDFSTDMINDGLTQLTELGAITVLNLKSDKSFKIEQIGKFILRIPLSARNSTLLYKWIASGYPVFIGVLAITMIDVNTTFNGSYFYYSPKMTPEERANHTGKFYAGFRYYKNNVSRSGLETLLNMWVIMTDEVRSWTQLFGDRFSRTELKEWTEANSINYQRLSSLIDKVNTILGILSIVLNNDITIDTFEPHSLIDKLRPFISEVYSKMTMNYYPTRNRKNNRGYNYNMAQLHFTKYLFTYKPQSYLSTMVIRPASSLVALDINYQGGDARNMGYITLAVDIENEDLSDNPRPLFNPTGNFGRNTPKLQEPDVIPTDKSGKSHSRIVSSPNINAGRQHNYPPNNDGDTLESEVKIIDSSLGNIRVDPSNEVIFPTSSLTQVLNTDIHGTNVTVARDTDGILFPSASISTDISTSALSSKKSLNIIRFENLRQKRENERPYVTIETIQRDLRQELQPLASIASSTLSTSKLAREVSNQELSVMNRKVPGILYDSMQDIGIQDYLTNLTRIPFIPMEPIEFTETRGISFGEIPIIQITENIINFNKQISFNITDKVDPPTFLAPTFTLMTNHQIDGEFHRIARLEELLRRVLLEVSKGKNKGFQTVKNGTKKAFTRWFFNVNADGNIIGMYPKDASSLNKYSMLPTEKFQFKFTDGMLASTPVPSGVSYESVKEKVNKRTAMGRKDIRKYYMDKYELTERMLYMYAYRYASLDVPTMSLAVPPELIELWRIDIELFGSLFNTVKPYGSAFQDEPKSIGNFFSPGIILESDKVYLANPPYDEELMKRMSNSLVDSLNKTSDLLIYVVLPVWDQKGRISLGKKAEGVFEAYNILINSGYVKESEMRTDVQFYDYYTQRKINPTPVRLMVLSNKEGEIPVSPTKVDQINRTTSGEITARDQYLTTFKDLKSAVEDLVTRVKDGRLPFPYGRTFRLSAEEQLDNFRKYTPNIETGRYKLNYRTPNNVFIPNYFRSYDKNTSAYSNVISRSFNWNTIDSFADTFTEEERMVARKGYAKTSISQDWQNPTALRKTMTLFLTDPKMAGMTAKDLRNAITFTSNEATNFKMTWAKGALYTVFSPTADWTNMKWLDISAGWGDRMGAAIGLGTGYLGFDPNTSLQKGHSEMINKFGSPDKQRVIYAPFESYDLRPIVEANGGFDFVFSSPPFFMQEIYSGGEQSTEKYTSYTSWIRDFLFVSLQNAWSALKDGGYLMIHMGDNSDGKKTQPTNEQMNLYIEQYLVNSSWEGVVGLQGNKAPSAPVWVWKKAFVGEKRNVWRSTIKNRQAPSDRSMKVLYPHLV